MPGKRNPPELTGNLSLRSRSEEVGSPFGGFGTPSLNELSPAALTKVRMQKGVHGAVARAWTSVMPRGGATKKRPDRRMPPGQWH